MFQIKNKIYVRQIAFFADHNIFMYIRIESKKNFKNTQIKETFFTFLLVEG